MRVFAFWRFRSTRYEFTSTVSISSVHTYLPLYARPPIGTTTITTTTTRSFCHLNKSNCESSVTRFLKGLGDKLYHKCGLDIWQVNAFSRNLCCAHFAAKLFLIRKMLAFVFRKQPAIRYYSVPAWVQKLFDNFSQFVIFCFNFELI